MTSVQPQELDRTFVYWAEQRELAREAKENNSPLTRRMVDPIIQRHRFCNVSREDDKTTRWIKKYIRDRFDNMADEHTLLLALCLARFINLPETLGELLTAGAMTSSKGIQLNKVAEVVTERQRQGKKTYSAAYMVRSETNKESRAYGEGKIAYICQILSKVEMPDCSSREAFVGGLSSQYGFGTFMAGQVAADAAYTRLLRKAPDHMTWAPMGPGALRGMNRALRRPINAPLNQEEYNYIGRLQMDMLPKRIVEGRGLTLHDVASNVNCETDKYLRVKNKEGNTRRYEG